MFDTDFEGQDSQTLRVVHTNDQAPDAVRCIVTDDDVVPRSEFSQGARLTVNNADGGCDVFSPTFLPFDIDGPGDGWVPYCYEDFHQYDGYVEFHAGNHSTNCPVGTPGVPRIVNSNVPIPIGADTIRVSVKSIYAIQGLPRSISYRVRWGDGEDEVTEAVSVTAPTDGQWPIVDLDVSDLNWGPEEGEDVSGGYYYRDISIELHSGSWTEVQFDEVDLLPGPRTEFAGAPPRFTTYTTVGGHPQDAPTAHTAHGIAYIVHPGIENKAFVTLANTGCAGVSHETTMEFSLCDVATGACYDEALVCQPTIGELNEVTFHPHFFDETWSQEYMVCAVTPPHLPDGTVLRFRGQRLDDPGSQRTEQLVVVRQNHVTDLEIDTSYRLEALVENPETGVKEKRSHLARGQVFDLTTTVKALHTPVTVDVPVHVYGALRSPDQMTSSPWVFMGSAWTPIEDHTTVTITDVSLAGLEFPEGTEWGLLDLLVFVDPPQDVNDTWQDDFGVVREGGGIYDSFNNLEYMSNSLYIDKWAIVSATEDAGLSMGSEAGFESFGDEGSSYLSFGGVMTEDVSYGEGSGHYASIVDSDHNGLTYAWWGLPAIPDGWELSGVAVRYQRYENHANCCAMIAIGTGPSGFNPAVDIPDFSDPAWVAAEGDMTHDHQWHVGFWKTTGDGPFAGMNFPVINVGGVPVSNPNSKGLPQTLMFRFDEEAVPETTSSEWTKRTRIDSIRVFMTQVEGNPLGTTDLARLWYQDPNSKNQDVWSRLPPVLANGATYRIAAEVDVEEQADEFLISQTIRGIVRNYTRDDPHGEGPAMALTALPQAIEDPQSDSRAPITGLLFELYPTSSSKTTGGLTLTDEHIGVEVAVIGAGDTLAKQQVAGGDGYIKWDDDATTINHPESAIGYQESGIDISQYETINPANGNLTFRIPLYTLTTEAGPSFPVALTYNSKIWSYHFMPSLDDPGSGVDPVEQWAGFNTARGTENVGLGWGIHVPHLVSMENEHNTYSGTPDGIRYLAAIVDSSGGRHSLYGLTPGEAEAWLDANPGSYLRYHQCENDVPQAPQVVECYTWDGSNIKVEIHSDGARIATMPDGSTYTFGQTVIPLIRGFHRDYHEIVDFREEVAGYYVTEIARGPFQGAVASNRIAFEYVDTMIDPPQAKGLYSEIARWLPSKISVVGPGGQEIRAVAFSYERLGGTDGPVVLKEVIHPSLAIVDQVNGGSAGTAPIDFEIAVRPMDRLIEEPGASWDPLTTSAPFLESITFPDQREFRFTYLSNPGGYAELKSVQLPSDAQAGTVEYDYGYYKSLRKKCAPSFLYDIPGCGVGSRQQYENNCSLHSGAEGVAARGVVQRHHNSSDLVTGDTQNTASFDSQLICTNTDTPFTFGESLNTLSDYHHTEHAYLVTTVSEKTGGSTTGAPFSTVHRYQPLSLKEFSTSVLDHRNSGGKSRTTSSTDPANDAKVIHHTEDVIENLYRIWAVDGDDTTVDSETTFVARSHTYTDPDGEEDVRVCMADGTCQQTTTATLVDSFQRPICSATCSDFSIKSNSYFFADPVSFGGRQQHWDCGAPADSVTTATDPGAASYGVSRWAFTRFKAVSDWRLDITDLAIAGDVSSAASSVDVCSAPWNHLDDDAQVVSRGWSNHSGTWLEDWVMTNPDQPANSAVAEWDTASDDFIKHEAEYDAFGSLTTDTITGGYGSTGGNGDAGGPGLLKVHLITGRDSNGAPIHRSKRLENAIGQWLRLAEHEIDPTTGFLTSQVVGNGSAAMYEYDRRGRITRITPATGNASSVAADPSVNQTRIAYCPPGSTSNGCTGDSRLHNVVFDVDGANQTAVESYYFDELGRLQESRELYLGVDQNGDPIVSTRAKGYRSYIDDTGIWSLESTWGDGTIGTGWTRSESDALGRSTKVILPDGSTVSNTYGGSSWTETRRRIISQTSESAEPTEFWVMSFQDPLGRARRTLEQINDNRAVISDYWYDAADRLVEVQVAADQSDDRSSQSRTFAYSPGGFLTETIEPEIASQTSAYDALGHPLIVKTAIDPGNYASGATTASSFDDFGRLESTTTTFGTIHSVSSFFFDTSVAPFTARYNRVVRAQREDSAPGQPEPDRCVIQEWAFNGRQSMVSEKKTSVTWGACSPTPDHIFVQNYAYDAHLNPESVEFPRGESEPSRLLVANTFGAAGRDLAQIAIQGSGLSTGAAFGYLPSGLTAQIATTAPGWIQRITGDSEGMARPAALALSSVNAYGGETLEWMETLSYDPSGNVRQIVLSENGQATIHKNYAYDGLNRLVDLSRGEFVSKRAQDSGWTYDIHGNLTAMTRDDGTTEFQVDETNRLISTSLGAPTYDVLGNMTAVPGAVPGLVYTGDNRILTTGTGVSFAYDVAGERVAATDALGNETVWVRDEGGALLSEVSFPGGVATYIDYVNSGTKMLAQIEGTNVRWAMTDHLGSTRALSDGAGSLQVMEFHPYGELMGSVSPDTDRLFTGHERDFDLRLDYMHARYYSPVLGRFLSIDPVGGQVGSSQSWNRYAYVRGNPLILVDPTGMRDAYMPDGEVHDVEPGDPYSQINIETGVPHHVGMVVDFTDVEDGETPEAVIIEGVSVDPTQEGKRVVNIYDSSSHQPQEKRASEASHRGDRFRTKVFRNRREDDMDPTRPLESAEVRQAIVGSGTFRYSGMGYGTMSTDSEGNNEGDCASYLNDLLLRLDGYLVPRGDVQTWK